ncbi:histone H4 [Senna tora]|uniref:Histone H4 n=1 Tax=Senna tora TaxID=362788 RepID=A0A834WAC5_9FABA|nr:histone H4 [Senna tora]
MEGRDSLKGARHRKARLNTFATARFEAGLLHSLGSIATAASPCCIVCIACDMKEGQELGKDESDDCASLCHCLHSDFFGLNAENGVLGFSSFAEIKGYPRSFLKNIHKFRSKSSTAKPIEGPSLPLERINHIHSSNGLPPSVLRVSHCITNHIFQENLKHSSSLLIDQATDPLDTSSSRQSPNRRLRDTLDVIAQNLAMPLCSSFAQTLASLSTT